MKKSKFMRAAAILMAAVLLTTCAISGTFAKYTTTASANDSARVAKWGFQTTSMTLDLFDGSYTNVASGNTENVIAPGTSKTATFTFLPPATAPEVAYTFAISASGTCDASITSNPNIHFYLDGVEVVAGTTTTNFEELIAGIKALSGAASGTQTYAAGTLPTAFAGGATGEHTVGWAWDFETATGEGQPGAQDTTDTAMGNAVTPAACNITISVTATQVD